MLGKNKPAGQIKENLKDITLIAKSASLQGDIHFSGSLRVEGQVVGNIIAESDTAQLTVGESGKVQGEIRVPTILINGRVDGDVRSSAHVELAAKASVTGNVYYNTMEMVLGAEVNGSLLHEVSAAGNGVEKKQAAPKNTVEETPGATN